MYQIIIVDDEPEIASGIAFMIRRFCTAPCRVGPGPDAVDTEASAGLRVSGEGADWRGLLHATIRWRRGEDGWRIVHAAVRAETEEGFP